MAILVVLAIGAWYAIDQTTIVVHVENAGREPMDDVAIVIGGTRWHVGRLAAGQSRSRRYFDSGSHARVDFVDAAGLRHDETTGPYLDPYAHGSLKVRIEDGGVVKVESLVR